MPKKNLKKYVVFQIWGNDPLFLIGLIENVKLSPQIYPKWKIRIYYNDVPDHWLLRIKKYPVELIKETFNKKIKFQIWRILPLFDKKVDIFICRDADSRINYREKAAVDNWLESEKPLHIMRDHPRGHKSIILAGMCGFNNRVIRKTIKLKDSDLIHKLKLNDRDTDQEFLRKFIFPFFAHNHIAHDKYNHFNYGCEGDFPPVDPTKRKICNFVGEVHDYYNNPILWGVKSKLQLVDLDAIQCCEIYGFKIPTEIECMKLELATELDHNPSTSYYPRLFDREFTEIIKKNKSDMEINVNDNKKSIEMLKIAIQTDIINNTKLIEKIDTTNLLNITNNKKNTHSKLYIQLEIVQSNFLILQQEMRNMKNNQCNIKNFFWIYLISNIIIMVFYYKEWSFISAFY